MAWWKICVVGGGYIFLVIIRRLVRRRRLCKSTETMEGKTVLITGASSGIGEATALELAKRHARVILACRDVDAAENSVKYIRRYTSNGELVIRQVHMDSFGSISQFCEEIEREEPRLDVLINNAGVFQCTYEKTVDGFEMQMGVNHLGHFLMTGLLREKLRASAPSRIIVVSSSLHKYGKINFDDFNSEKHYDKKKAYSNSKLANCLFTRELSEHLEDTGVTVYCVHPGFVATKLSRHVLNSFLRRLLTPIGVLLSMKTAEEGCQTIIYCAVATELEKETGGYYGNCRRESWSEAASDMGVAKKLWELSDRFTDPARSG